VSEPDCGPLAAKPDLPARGALGDSTERLCGRQVPDGLCGKPASIHIIWEDKADYVEHGMACAEHAPEVVKRWKPFATHPLGPCCGMPGSTYHIPPENECRIDGELPTVEPVRAIAVAA
jgi:hypothetical protein